MTLSCKPWPVIVILVAELVVTVVGCERSPEFNKDTQYTSESLAQELVFRYKALSPSGKTSTRARKPQKRAVDSKADEQSPTKSQAKAATKKDLPRTIDDVLDDIAVKANLVQGMSRPEVFGKMAEAISKDGSLTESDRQMLAEKLKELGSG